MGKSACRENLDALIRLYSGTDDPDIRREIVSSIGRQKEKDIVLDFIKARIFDEDCMEIVYQMYRTILYNRHIPEFADLMEKADAFYRNEFMAKMRRFRERREKRGKKAGEAAPPISAPLILEGDSALTLKKLPAGSVNLVFTSPPYYNARMYANYRSYAEYLDRMRAVFAECARTLEEGRFMVVNVSPVIARRAGRDFESIRYPIPFDFHRLLTDCGCHFIDDIVWVKPESSVPNRVSGYRQTRRPLSYKPNCVTEYVLVYRKNADFPLDRNMARYPADYREDGDFDSTNCWRIAPKSDRDHPAVFPEELCRRVLKYYSFKGDIALDPFAGSGTLGRVALRMGRIPVLCERDPAYAARLKREFGELAPVWPVS